MDVSIIIINYNTKTLLRQCLQSVSEKTKDIAYEIIVVDNASSDGSQVMLKEEFSYVKLVESKENLGFGRANNLGASYAKGKYLFLLNSDTLLINNAVKMLFDFLESRSQAGVCCGNVFDENKQPGHSYFMYLSPFFRDLNLLLGFVPEKLVFGKSATFNHTRQEKRIGDPTAADLMIRSDLFRKVNGFDSDFFMYGEDRHLNYKVKQQHYEMYNIPWAEIIHLDGKSATISLNRSLMIRNGSELYCRKTQNRAMQTLCRMIFFLVIYSRLNYFKIRKNKEKCDFWRVLLDNEKKLRHSNRLQNHKD